MNNKLPKGLRIAVLRGGPSEQHEASKKTGRAVIEALSKNHHALDIFIDHDGVWHLFGIPKNPVDIVSHVDVVFNALHGAYGEDGQVQQILNRFNIPYTGSKTLGSIFAMNKSRAKELFNKAGINTPISKTFTWSPEDGEEELAKIEKELFLRFPIPAIVKPVGLGGSFGTSIYRNKDEIWNALIEGFSVSPTVIVEEYISGKEVTASLLEGFRGQELYVAPVVEVCHGKELYCFEDKHSQPTQLICPACVLIPEKEAVIRATRMAHKVLHLEHCSRADFIIHPKRGIYLLETNCLPALHDNSPYVQAFESVGVKFDEIVEHLVHLALLRK